jgi:serine/threonine-protein kinase
MGEVFRAHDAVLDRPVAIKVLHRNLSGDSGFVERFRREARAAANLNHPNIVAVHDWGAVDGIYYMVMEHVAGTSVREIVNAEGLLAPPQAADVTMQALAALEHAHRQGIVHRDIKPENLMVTRDGIVKVADFGLARAYADAQISEAGTVTGTVQYLAPEQLQGEPADPRTDLYALGIVTYELLTGRLPFTGETPMAIAMKHLRERVPRPSARNPAVPPSLDGWVASVTEPQRELRPESAAEAKRDLAADLADLPSAPPLSTLVPEIEVIPVERDANRASTVTVPRQPAGDAPRRRRKGRILLALLFALLAIGAAAWGAWAYLLPKPVDVPAVVGMDVDRARAALEEAGLVVRIGQGRHSVSVPEGRVIRVQPPEGTTLEEGERVTLTASLGPPPVPVPDLVGLPLVEAKEALRDAKLKLGRVTPAFSARFTADEVIRQSVRPDEQAPQGSEIDLVVSKGPAPVPVPKVVGLSVDEATDALVAQGFHVAVQDEFSDRVPRGRVMAQQPSRGTDLQPGETVTIVVSLGPEEFAVPNFVDRGRDAAVAAIRDLGLVPEVIELPGAVGELTVATQLPIAGTMVRVGTTITIYVA